MELKGRNTDMREKFPVGVSDVVILFLTGLTEVLCGSCTFFFTENFGCFVMDVRIAMA